MKLFFTGGDKLLALPRGINEIDVTTLGHRQGVTRIAGKSKSTVGKGENHAAMAGSMSVQHICSHRHMEPCKSGSNLIDPDAERTCGRIIFINPVGNAPGRVFRFVPCAGFCLGIIHTGDCS